LDPSQETRMSVFMMEAGVTTEPRIAFWHPVDTPDQY
jgi:hypothetical protein